MRVERNCTSQVTFVPWMWLQLWSLQRLGHVGLTRSPDRLITARSLLFMLTSQIIWLKSAGEAKAQWDVTFLNRGVNTPILEVILWAITEKISLFTLRAEIVLNLLISKSPSTAAWNSSQLLSCEIKCSHLDVYSETSIFWEGSGSLFIYIYIYQCETLCPEADADWDLFYNY